MGGPSVLAASGGVCLLPRFAKKRPTGKGVNSLQLGQAPMPQEVKLSWGCLAKTKAGDALPQALSSITLLQAL